MKQVVISNIMVQGSSEGGGGGFRHHGTGCIPIKKVRNSAFCCNITNLFTCTHTVQMYCTDAEKGRKTASLKFYVRVATV